MSLPRRIHRRIHRSRVRVAALAALVAVAIAVVIGPAVAADPPDLLAEVAALVEAHFYDPARLVGWSERVAAARHALPAEPSRADLVTAARRLLAGLDASHTALYTADDRERAFYLAIFEPALAAAHPELYEEPGRAAALGYVGIGITTVELEGRIFVESVLDGSPAAAADLRVGDELVAVAGEPYRGLPSFAGRAGETVALTVRRHRDAAPFDLTVVPRHLAADTLFLDAQRASARVETVGERRVAYVHVWSYAGAATHELLVELTQNGLLATADALVVDLRGGLGGADPDYLHYFRPRTPRLVMTARDGTELVPGRAWRKPVVLLVDHTTRSGKEILAHAFRRHAIGPVVGTRTAGAVLAGRPFLLTDGTLLYLAAYDVHVDGERLEGRGVEPDVEVPFELPYAAGSDPRLDRGFEVAAGLVATD